MDFQFMDCPDNIIVLNWISKKKSNTIRSLQIYDRQVIKFHKPLKPGLKPKYYKNYIEF